MKILHLTDIHANIQQPEKFLIQFQRMTKAVAQLPADWQPEVLVLTGDFGYHGSKQEFQLAERCIRMVFKETSLSASLTIACEGNHDAEYTGTNNSFIQYEQFLKRLKISRHSLSIEETSIFSINTCSQTTPEHCNHAVLTIDTFNMFPENSILIMHHPPHLVSPSYAMKNLARNSRLILSGHIHPETPSVTLFENTLSLNGCAFTPAEPDSPWGCQIIRISNYTLPSFIEIGSLLTSSENPDFHFSAAIYPFS